MKINFLLIFTFTVLISDVFISQKQAYLVEDNEKYTFEMISSDLDSLNKLYPNITELFSIGKSEFGFPIEVLRIGSKNINTKSILFVGNIHAREDFSSKFIMKFINLYLLSISKDSIVYEQAVNYLDEVNLYFIPVANPDGLKIAHENWVNIEKQLPEIKKIKKRGGFTEWKANGNGIDLNDSFDDGTHTINQSSNLSLVPCSEGYKGKYPAEPIETKVIQKFISEILPLITLSFHTKGNIIYWADSKTHEYFNGIDTKINNKVTKASKFNLAPVSPNPVTYGGGLENYVRFQFGLLGSCIELSISNKTRTQHPDNQFNNLVWKKAWEIPIIYIENAILYSDEIISISKKNRLK